MRKIILTLFFVFLLVGTISAQLTKDESDALFLIEETIKKLDTSVASIDTSVCEDIKEIVQIPTMSMFGTEYQVGDSGTSFIQLLDDNRQAINDASCYIDAYYPNKTAMWSNTILTYLSSSDGLYYKDFTVPTTIGLYMLSSTCYIPASGWVDYFDDYSMISAYENITVEGGVVELGFLPSEEFRWVQTSTCAETTGAPDSSYTEIGGGLDCLTQNISLTGLDNVSLYNVSFVFVFNVTTQFNNDVLDITYCYDSPGCTSSNLLENYNDLNTPVDFLDFPYRQVNIGLLNYTQIRDIKLEMDVTKNGPKDSDVFIDTIGIKIILGDVINYTDGWLYSEEIELNNESGGWDTFSATYDNNSQTINFWVTDQNNNTLCTGLGDISSCASTTSPIKLYSQLNRTPANATSPELDSWTVSWLVNETIREVKGAGELHVSNYVSDLTTEINEVANEVWQYNETINPGLLNQIGNAIWNWTGGIADSIGDFFADKVWTRPSRNLTYYEVTEIDYPKLQLYVWNNTDRNLTYYEDTTNYTKITKDVWDYFNRTLTYYPPTNNLTAQDVWDYVNRTLTYYPPTNNLTASEVWNFLNRNLTYYPPASVDYPTLQIYVWNATDRNLTYYEDTTNYTQMKIEVWNYSAKYTHGEVLS